MKLLKTWMRRLSFRGLSIQQRLPILICVLLLSVIITGGLVSYLKIRNDALKSGGQRLLSSGDQLSNLLGQSSQNLVNTTRALALQEPVKQFLQSRDTGSRSAAMEVLRGLKDTSTILLELYDKQLLPLIHKVASGYERSMGLGRSDSARLRFDTGQVGKFFIENGQLFFPVVVGTVIDNQLEGYLVRWRRVSNNPRSMQQMIKLMGLTEAKVYFGNDDNSIWTDMNKVIPAPVPDEFEKKEDVLSYKNLEGTEVIAVRKPVKLAHWQFLIEESRQSILQPARNYLRQLIIIGSILLLFGIIWAWLMSRNITKPLNRLTAATSLIAHGNYSMIVAVDRRDEIGKLARAFNAMVTQLSKTRERLEQKVIEAQAANEQLRNLSAHLQNIREEERIHIAREMHDELGQLLTGFKMDVSWLHKKLGDSEDPGVKEKLQEMMGIVNEAAIFVRKLASELRPSILDDLGLVAALDWHSHEFRRRANIEVEFRSEVNELKTSELIATGLFRMYQESLTNVARHAEAKKVVSLLEVKNGEAVLSITDDGKGFDLNGTGERKTLGLLGMKERATMIGGKLEIRSAPGKGTTILISVPLHQTTPKEPVFS